MSVGTVHFVYPHGPSISCPDAIGRNVGERLSTCYDVRYYDWDEARTLRPGANDVLLGHPHPAPWTIFRRSARAPGWRRVIVLSPYAHGDDVQVAFLDRVVARADLYLAITGRYWFDSVAESLFAHWRPKMVHVDLAVDRGDFPPLEREFRAPGERRFVYIGHCGWYKNTAYLSEIARAMPDTRFSWIGAGDGGIPGLRALGRQNFATAGGRSAVAEHDFLLTVGRADANPTTILEAMAWGLLPVCTPQSGYVGYGGISNVPLDDVRGAVAVLRRLQGLPESDLRSMQTANWALLNRHFNWDRVTEQVVEAIESDASPPSHSAPFAQRTRIRWGALRSPYAPWRPRTLLAGAWAALRSRLRARPRPQLSSQR